MKKIFFSIAFIAMGLSMAAQTEYPIIQPDIKINNSPWHGLGRSNITFSDVQYPAVQLAGYYGMLLKTGQGDMSMLYNGNVGIGTTSPVGKLDVRGDIAIKYGSSLKVHTNWAGNGNDKILKTGWTASRGNYVDLFVPGNKADGNSKITMLQNGNVGIGTTTPQHLMDIKGNHENTRLLLHSKGGGSEAYYADLTLWASEPGLTYSGVGIGNNIINLPTAPFLRRISNKRGASYIRLLEENMMFNIITKSGSNINALNISNQGNVGIGTTTPDSKLAVNGKIHTKEVKVDLEGWSDFVFYNTYKLPTLKEVENHIKEKGHLKDIPSEREVLSNGIELGKMNSKLLQKIEELTLYTIQQEKKIQEQENKINKQSKELASLKNILARLAVIEKKLQTK